MPSKLDFYHHKFLAPADQLREALQSLENDLPLLPKQNSSAILTYLTRLDDLQQRFDALAGGPNLEPERLRFITLQDRLQKNAPRLLDRTGGAAALKAARPADASPERAKWWFLEQEVARRRAKAFKRGGIIVGGAAVLALIGVILFNTLLKPDPKTVLRAHNFAAAVDLAAYDHNYSAALSQLDEALAVLPDDPELLIFKGVLLQRLGRAGEAEAIFERAARLSPAAEYLPLARGQIYLQLKQPEAALEDGLQATAAAPDSAEAWFLLGRAYTALEQIPQAHQALSKAADLAFEQGDDTLYAIIKINLGYLQQQPAPLGPMTR